MKSLDDFINKDGMFYSTEEQNQMAARGVLYDTDKIEYTAKDLVAAGGYRS